MWDLEVRPVTVLVALLLVGAGALVAGRVTASGPRPLTFGPPTVQFVKVLTPHGMRVLTCQQTAVAVSCLRPHGRP